MNAALRRRHLRWWVFLALVLPILVWLGLSARPEWPSQPVPDLEAGAQP